MGVVNLDEVRYLDFERQVGSVFTLRGDSGAPLRLLEVSPVVTSGSWESFSLVFSGPSDVPLDQRVHVLDHGQLGELELFLVPLEPDAGELRYESVFNRAAVDTGGT
jgi:hypothetical protein